MLEVRNTLRHVGIRQRSLRKHCRLGRATELVFVLATGTILMLAGAVNAQDSTFTNGEGTGAWNTVDDNWSGGPADPEFTAGDNAIFSDTDGVVTIDEAGGISAGSLTVQDGGAGILIIQGNDLTLGGNIDVQTDAAATINATITGNADAVGAGSLSLSGVGGNVSNGGTGGVTITGGVTGSLTSTNGSTSIIDGGTIGAGVTINGGSLTVNATNDATAEVTGATTLTDGVLAISDGNLGAVINQGTSGGATEVTLTAGDIASLTNTSGDTALNGGTVTGATTVAAGTVTNAGAAIATATTSGGTYTQSGGSATDLVNDSGTVNLDAGTATSLTNNATAGTSTVTDGQVTGTTTIDGGTVVVNQTTADADLELVGDTTLNDGTLTITDGEVGAVINNGGTFNLNASGVVQGTFTNNNAFTFSAGTLNDVTNTSTFTGSGTNTVNGTFLNDGGTLELDPGANLTTGALTNQNGGAINIDTGETLNATVDNTGAGTTTTIAGTLVGGLTNQSGAQLVMSTGGSLNGTVTNTSDFDFNGGTVAAVDNNTGGDLDVTGMATVDGAFTNAGALDLANGSNLTIGAGGSGTLVNETGGVLTPGAGASTLTANLDLNAGSTLDMSEAPGSYTDTTLNVSGNATLNGEVELDVVLSSGSTLGDTIDVGGNIDGTVDLTFNISGVPDEIGQIDLITYGGSSALSFGTISNLPLFGAFEYFVEDDGVGTVSLQSQVNGGIGNLAAGIGLTQSVVGSIINRPTSPYVTDYVGFSGESRARTKRQADTSAPCGPGAWARVSGGSADVEGSIVVGGSDAVGSSQDLNYYGIQAGGDIACFDDRFNGFDMAFGVIAGYNTGDTFSSSVIANSDVLDTTLETDFSQAYAGIYATASRGSFFADLQLRYENIDYEADVTFDNPVNGTLDDITDFSTDGYTVSGAVGYSWQIPSVEGLAFVGTAGFSYSDFETDTVTITGTDAGGGATTSVLALDDSTIELGFVSGTLSKSRVLPDEISAINYFGTFTYYNDFASEPTAVLEEAGTTANLQLSNLGSYGEISLGVNYIRLLNTGSDGKARQLSAAARVDYRSGSNVDSYGITGQVRIQF